MLLRRRFKACLLANQMLQTSGRSSAPTDDLEFTAGPEPAPASWRFERFGISQHLSTLGSFCWENSPTCHPMMLCAGPGVQAFAFFSCFGSPFKSVRWQQNLPRPAVSNSCPAGSDDLRCSAAK
jgi:hypothetical protein